MWDVEASLVTRDGRKKYTHAIARPARKADGSVVWTGIILDETRTREAVVECLSQGFLLYDSDDRLILRNSHYLKLYPSMSDVAVPGASYGDIVRAEAASVENTPAAQERIERHREPRRVFELQLADKQWVMVNEHRTGDGNTVVLYTDISEIKQREGEISYLAHHDSLTGLANRSTFLAKIEEASARHRQWGETFNVFMMDLDEIQERQRYAGASRRRCHAQRDGAAPEVDPARNRCSCAAGRRRVRHHPDRGDRTSRMARSTSPTRSSWRSREPYEIVGNKVQVGVSIGIAFAPDHGIDANELLKKADLALYKAKSGGRNDYRIFDATMGQIADARQKLEAELREALANDQLELHYQPIVDFKTHELCGMEALVRWRHPQRGMVLPGQFIPIAEETGLINKIGEWLLERACTEAAAWPKPIKVAVNLSPVQLGNSNLLDVVLCALVEFGFAAGAAGA